MSFPILTLTEFPDVILFFKYIELDTIPTEKAGLIVFNSVVILKEVQFSKTEPPIVKDTSLSFISTHKLCFCLRSNTLLSYHQWSYQTLQVEI